MSTEPSETSSEKQQVHTYDGIEEHDNHMPSWWTVTLLGSIVFAFLYWGYYQTIALGDTQAMELAKDQNALALVRKAQKKEGLSDDVLIAAKADDALIASGKQVFMSNCVACHGPAGGGTPIAPNLTDSFWLHGAKPSQIYATIQNGVLEKGMLAWGDTLGDEKVKQVALFIMSIQNTNIAGGKEPQGTEEK